MNSVFADGSLAIREHLHPVEAILNDPEVVELAINRPGELWTKTRAEWHAQTMPAVTLAWLRSFAAALAAYNRVPMQSASIIGTLPTGERVQVLKPPACAAEQFIVSIRKHRVVTKTLPQLLGEGAFSETRSVIDHDSPAPPGLPSRDRALLSYVQEAQWPSFFEVAVRMRKNIVIAGATGSGKTTLARTLAACIPLNERLVTIEDVPELVLPHDNRVSLMFGGEGRITATECVRHSLRLLPSRILISELRGDEAWDWLTACNTGHPGGISTVHANSARAVFSRVADLVQQSRAGNGLPEQVVERTLRDTLEVVVFMRDWRVIEVLFDPVASRAFAV